MKINNKYSDFCRAIPIGNCWNQKKLFGLVQSMVVMVFMALYSVVPAGVDQQLARVVVMQGLLLALEQLDLLVLGSGPHHWVRNKSCWADLGCTKEFLDLDIQVPQQVFQVL